MKRMVIANICKVMRKNICEGRAVSIRKILLNVFFIFLGEEILVRSNVGVTRKRPVFIACEPIKVVIGSLHITV